MDFKVHRIGREGSEREREEAKTVDVAYLPHRIGTSLRFETPVHVRCSSQLATTPFIGRSYTEGGLTLRDAAAFVDRSMLITISRLCIEGAIHPA